MEYGFCIAAPLIGASPGLRILVIITLRALRDEKWGLPFAARRHQAAFHALIMKLKRRLAGRRLDDFDQTIPHEPSLTVLDWLLHSRRSSVAIDLSACEE